MIILLSNDDGYNANGIKVLSKSLDQIARVILCAPMENHSGSSSSLSLRKDISVKQIEKDVFVFSGTPADTVHLGLSGFLDVTPDLVVSGINHGANLGEDILYSGTVAAAIEGRVLDMPSIAVSSLGDTERDFKVAARVTIELIQRLKKYPLPKETILNVNVPAINYEKVNGFCITRLRQSP
jgi:5''/3''-nucleotidase SurE